MLVGKSFIVQSLTTTRIPRLTSDSATIELSIFISQAVWLFRTRKIRQRAKEAEMDWEKFPEAQTWQSNRWRLRSALGMKSRKPVQESEANDADLAEAAVQEAKIERCPSGEV